MIDKTPEMLAQKLYSALHGGQSGSGSAVRIATVTGVTPTGSVTVSFDGESDLPVTPCGTYEVGQRVACAKSEFGNLLALATVSTDGSALTGSCRLKLGDSLDLEGARVGSVLTVEPVGTPADADLSMVWFSNNSPLLTETSSSYFVSTADVNSYVYCVMFDSSGKYDGVISSNETEVIMAQSLYGTVTMSDYKPKPGETITALFQNGPLGVQAYWELVLLRHSTDSSGQTTVVEALRRHIEEPTYLVSQEADGCFISFEVSDATGKYPGSVKAVATETVSFPRLENEPPTILPLAPRPGLDTFTVNYSFDNVRFTIFSNLTSRTVSKVRKAGDFSPVTFSALPGEMLGKSSAASYNSGRGGVLWVRVEDAGTSYAGFQDSERTDPYGVYTGSLSTDSDLNDIKVGDTVHFTVVSRAKNVEVTGRAFVLDENGDITNDHAADKVSFTPGIDSFDVSFPAYTLVGKTLMLLARDKNHDKDESYHGGLPVTLGAILAGSEEITGELQGPGAPYAGKSGDIYATVNPFGVELEYAKQGVVGEEKSIIGEWSQEPRVTYTLDDVAYDKVRLIARPITGGYKGEIYGPWLSVFDPSAHFFVKHSGTLDSLVEMQVLDADARTCTTLCGATCINKTKSGTIRFMEPWVISVDKGVVFTLVQIGAASFKDCAGLLSFYNQGSMLTTVCKEAFSGCAALSYIQGLGLADLVGVDPVTGASYGSGYRNFYRAGRSVGGLSITRLNSSEISIRGEIPEDCFRESSVASTYLSGSTATRIGPSAYRDSKVIRTNLGSSSVERIGQRAFQGCKKLVETGLADVTWEITLERPDAAEGRHFADCTKLVETGIGPLKFVGLSCSMFSGCTALVDGGITEETDTRMTAIPDSAFYGCTSLSANFSNSRINEVWFHAFNGCSSLTTDIFALNSSLTRVHRFAFRGCGFSSLDLTSVSFIEESAFRDCKSLETVDLGFDKAPKTTVGDYVFAGCTRLHTILGLGNTVAPYMFSGCTALESTFVPQSLSSLGQGAYSGCIALTSTGILPSSPITAIADSAFSGCSGLLYAFEEETPESKYSVKTIAPSAFKGCGSMLETRLPASVTEVGSSAFQDCVSIKKTGLTSSVKTLARLAFSGCKSLTDTELYNLTGCTEINESYSQGAFSGCTSLVKTGLISPDGSKVSSLTKTTGGTFKGCSSLTDLQLNGSNMTYLGDNFANNCQSLEEVKAGESRLFTIYYNAFSENRALKKLELPGGLSKIWGARYGAFNNCPALSTIVFDGGVETLNIENGSFTNDASISTVLFRRERPSSLAAVNWGSSNPSIYLTISWKNQSSIIYSEAAVRYGTDLTTDPSTWDILEGTVPAGANDMTYYIGDTDTTTTVLTDYLTSR